MATISPRSMCLVVLLFASTIGVLALPPPAEADVRALKTTLRVDERATVILVVSNERPRSRMNALTLVLPDDMQVVSAADNGDFRTIVDHTVATWIGGFIEPGQTGRFAIRLIGPRRVGVRTLEAIQGYIDGDQTNSTVRLSVGKSHQRARTLWAAGILFAATAVVVGAAVTLRGKARRGGASI